MSGTLTFAQLPNEATKTIDFAGHEGGIQITTSDQPFNISEVLRDPADFHGSTEVHALVNFYGAMAGLIGDFEGREAIPYNPADQVKENILILTNHQIPKATEIVSTLNGYAGQLFQNSTLYDDVNFCRKYLEATAQGYALLNSEVSSFLRLPTKPISVSLERAGLVTTRLARGESADAELEDEIKVVTKRAHPIDGKPSDLMVSVKWRDKALLQKLHGADVEIADFVNPASWASTCAFVLALDQMGIKPARLIHRSIMATDQGIAFATKVLTNMGIIPVFLSVGSSRTLTPEYYLQNPGVGDAGHALRHFLPSWYKA